MKQRNTLIAAAALTAFVLMFVAGLATRMNQSGEALSSPVGDAAADPTTATLDPAIEALVREREAKYQAALTEANRRLAAANDQIAAANQQLDQMALSQPAQGQPAQQQLPASAQAPAYAVSAEQAQAAALAAAPGAALQQAPELVRYQGRIAYEVALDLGLVYIDAQSGAVLNNSALANSPITREQAIQAAQAYYGGEVITAELTDVRGLTAYAVEFADGSSVYVEASSGQVAYADIQGGEHEEGEHEEGEHEEDD